jgi:cytochrome c-type biogenesis protein
MLDRSFSAVKALRKHAKLVMRFGGLLLIVIGVLLVTGLWNELTIQLRIWAADFTVAI